MTAAAEPGPLLGRGRAADVYDVGDGRVLRRYRSATSDTGGDIGEIVEREARVMHHLRAAGYPVPEVYEAWGTDMVMERLHGRTMLQEIGSKPWRVGAYARQLAELHRRLEDVPTRGLDLHTKLGAGEQIAHLDLHPGNVMMTPRGCVVFDWAGAALAPRGADVATTWILLTIGEADDVPRLLRPFEGAVRSQLRSVFLRGVDAPSREVVQSAGAIRLGDANLRPGELRQLAAFLAEHGTGTRAHGDDAAQPASDM